MTVMVLLISLPSSQKKKGKNNHLKYGGGVAEQKDTGVRCYHAFTFVFMCLFRYSALKSHGAK